MVYNASDGGLVVGIDDNGQLADVAYSATFDYVTSTHPDTGYVFKEHVIENYPKVVKAAYKLHDLMPQIKIINWNFSIGVDSEPVLIEINVMPSDGFDLSHIVNKCGAFGENAARVLEICNMLANQKKSQRVKTFTNGDIWS